jgi:hypothetical protein
METIAAGSGVNVLAGVEVTLPSGRIVLALLPLIVLVVGFVVYCLRDLWRARSVRYLPKPVWALVIVLGSVPFGAIAYLAFGRNRDDAPDSPPPVGEFPRHDDRASV